MTPDRRPRSGAVMAACLVLAGIAPPAAPPRTSPPVLAEEWPRPWLLEHLPAFGAWRPVPSIADRDAWHGLPEALRSLIIRRGEEALGRPIPALPATLYLDFPADAFASDSAAVDVIPPEGNPVSVDFDLSALR